MSGPEVAKTPGGGAPGKEGMEAEMLDEEDQDWFIPARDLPSGMGQIQQQLNGLSVSDRGNAEEMALYTIHGLQEGNMVPTVLMLLPNKTEGTYARAYAVLKSLRPDLKLHHD
ncbi:unnamed protein product, partial [Coregonus sp. 'balchen']